MSYVKVTYMYILKTKFIYLKERNISFVLVLLSNWPLSMSGLSFWYFFVSLHAHLTILPFVNVEFLFLLLCFFLRKKRLFLCFHYFHVAGLVHLWNGQFLLSVTSSTPISVYEFIWQLEGCFYSFMSLIFFNCRLFLLQFHHFFHFLCGFAVFLIVQCPPP